MGDCGLEGGGREVRPIGEAYLLLQPVRIRLNDRGLSKRAAKMQFII